MNLALVISSLTPGGAENVLARIASGLAGRGHGVRVLTLDDGRGPTAPLHPAVRRQILGLGGASGGLPGALAANLRRVLALRRALLAEPADAVLSFMAETNILALLAVGRELPVVAAERVHPGRHPLGRPWEALRRWTYPRAAAIAVQTADVADFFPPALRARCATIPNPVLPPPGSALEPPVAQALEGSGPVLLGMGRLAGQKGFDLLLRAFARVAGDFPHWRLAILGEGPERPALEGLVRELGLAGRAVLPGRTAAPAEAFAQSELFALPSRYEGFPNALAEALACGLPAVAFDCQSGPAELVRHGVDGLLVPPGDTEALALALARLMADDPLRRGMAARAPEVAARFGMEAVLDRWEELLDRAARRTGPGPCAA